MIISAHSRLKVYHRPGCRYAESIKENNISYEKTEWAELRGYRPCKWCSRMDGRFQIEKKAVGEYLANSGLVMVRKNHMLYIRSDIGCWKVVFSKKFNDFVLYHRNHADGIVPLAEVEKDSYHKQSDHFQFNSIMGAARYIVKHDTAKKILSIGSYKDLPRQTKKQKEYYKSAKNKAHRNSIQRIDDLFRQIEDQSRMQRYSFC